MPRPLDVAGASLLLVGEGSSVGACAWLVIDECPLARTEILSKVSGAPWEANHKKSFTAFRPSASADGRTEGDGGEIVTEYSAEETQMRW
jgi:hypothetical protein